MNLAISLQKPGDARIDIQALELRLEELTAPHQRIITIDELLAYYVFTDVQRAIQLLDEQRDILESYDYPDMQLNYFHFRAVTDNHLYRYEQAIAHFERAIELVEDRGDVKHQVEILIDFAGTLINTSDLEGALELLEKAEKLLKNFPDTRLTARIICREGFLNLHYTHYTRAIDLFMKAERMINSLHPETNIKDLYFLSLIYSGLGTLYEQTDEFEKSAENFERVIFMAENLHMRSRISWQYLNVGKAYMALYDLENAERFFKKALDSEDDTNVFAKASAFANLGYCLLNKQEFRQALELLEKAESLYLETEPDNSRNLAYISAWKGQIYSELGDDEMAKEHFYLSMKTAETVDDFKQLSSTSKDIAEFFAARSDFRNAYEFQVLHSKYSEQYIEEVNRKKNTELEFKYGAEKKKQEAELLRLQATKLQLKALRAQMNPHFLYNALNSIQNYITSNNTTFAAKYLAKFAKLMRQSLEYSDMESISLEKEIEFLEDYLYINQKLRFESSLTYRIEVDDEIEEDILGVPTMIVQPYVENAIEHGLRTRSSGLITIRFSLLSDDTILCVVEDNGIGRAKARAIQMDDLEYRNHHSLGTRITEDRLRLLHSSEAQGYFVKTIDLRHPNGTAAGIRVEIQIPVVDIQLK